MMARSRVEVNAGAMAARAVGARPAGARSRALRTAIAPETEQAERGRQKDQAVGGGLRRRADFMVQPAVVIGRNPRGLLAVIFAVRKMDIVQGRAADDVRSAEGR